MVQTFPILGLPWVSLRLSVASGFSKTLAHIQQSHCLLEAIWGLPRLVLSRRLPTMVLFSPFGLSDARTIRLSELLRASFLPSGPRKLWEALGFLLCWALLGSYLHSFLPSSLPLGLCGVRSHRACLMQNARAVPWIPALGDNQELECGVALSCNPGTRS